MSNQFNAARLFRFVRDKKRLSINEMAAELGICQLSLQTIETGQEYPSSEALGGLRELCSKNQQLGLGSLITFIALLGTPDE